MSKWSAKAVTSTVTTVTAGSKIPLLTPTPGNEFITVENIVADSILTNAFQAKDAGLTSISGLTTAADKMIYTTALDTYAVADLSAFARTLLDDTDATSVRATIGVDASGTDNSTDVTLVTTTADYLSITGQAITLGLVDLSTDVTGSLATGTVPWSQLTSVPSTFAPDAHTLDSHSNVTITANSAGEILKWDGSAWVNNTLAEAGIDPAGTDNSTNVTLSGSLDYLSLAGQVLTLGSIDLTTDVTGTLPVGNGGTGLTSISTLLNSNVTPATLGLVIGTNVQAYNARLSSIAGLTPASSLIIGNGLGGYEMVTPANFITNNNILDTGDIGVSVQAYNATLASVAGGTYTGDDSIVTIGTLSAGAVPASLVTAGTFPSGAYVFQGAVSGITTLGAGAITTSGAFTLSVAAATLASFTRTGSSSQARLSIANDTDAFYYGINGSEQWAFSPTADLDTGAVLSIGRTGAVTFTGAVSGITTLASGAHTINSGTTNTALALVSTDVKTAITLADDTTSVPLEFYVIGNLFYMDHGLAVTGAMSATTTISAPRINGSTGTGTLLLYGDSAATIPLTISDTGVISTTGYWGNNLSVGDASNNAFSLSHYISAVSATGTDKTGFQAHVNDGVNNVRTTIYVDGSTGKAVWDTSFSAGYNGLEIRRAGAVGLSYDGTTWNFQTKAITTTGTLASGALTVTGASILNGAVSGITTLSVTGNSTVKDLKLTNATSSIDVGTSTNATTVLDFDFPDISTATGAIRVFRNTNTSGTRDFTIYKGDGTGTSVFSVSAASSTVATGALTVTGAMSATTTISAPRINGSTGTGTLLLYGDSAATLGVSLADSGIATFGARAVITGNGLGSAMLQLINTNGAGYGLIITSTDTSSGRYAIKAVSGAGTAFQVMNNGDGTFLGTLASGALTVTDTIDLNHSSATGSPSLRFGQTTTRRSFIQHIDSGDDFVIASEYGSITLKTGTAGTEVTRYSISATGDHSLTGNTTVTGKITAVLASAPQGVFSGWSSTNGANTASGTIQLGTTDAYKGLVSYAADGNTTLSVDNTYDSASSVIQFRMRTAGTPLTPLSMTPTAVTVTGTGFFQNTGSTSVVSIFSTTNVLNEYATLRFGTVPGSRTKAEIRAVNANTGNAAGGLELYTNNGTALIKQIGLSYIGGISLLYNTTVTGTLGVTGATRFGSNTLTADTTYDDVVIETGSNTGLSILATNNASDTGIMLGSTATSTGAMFRWNHTGLNAKLATRVIGSSLILAGGANITNLTLSGASGSELATFAGNVILGATKRLYLDGNGDTYISESSANTILFTAAGGDRASIDGNGLTVHSGTLESEVAIEAHTYIQGTTANGFLDLRGDSGATKGLRILDTGLVVVGTGTGAYPLHVFTSSTGTAPAFAITNTSTSSSADAFMSFQRDNATSGFSFGVDSTTNNLVISNNGASLTGSVAEFDINGNFLLGATATSSNAQFYATKTYSAASGTDASAFFSHSQSVATTGGLQGVTSIVAATHTTGTVGAVYGILGYGRASGAGGTTTNAYGGYFNVQNLSASAVITNGFGVYIAGFTATGTITNRWGIYQAGASENNYLAGALRIGTTSAAGSEVLRVNGLIHSDSDSIIVDTAKTPATAAATGTTGQIAWDASYIYVCTATDTWKRSAIATW